MEVILLERIDKLGQMGQVVTVKPGYARNFLLPQKKAMRATKGNIAYFEGERTQLEAVNLERRTEAEDVAGRIEGLTVVVVRQASDSDQLYGSVSTRDIAQAVTEAGFKIEKGQVQLVRPIKAVGLHTVRVRLHPEVTISITANVARSLEEAATHARGDRPTTDADEIAIEEPETPEFLEQPAVPPDAEVAPSEGEAPVDDD